MPAPATAAATTYPLAIDNCGWKITFDEVPSRVVLLNSTSLAEIESIIALGIATTPRWSTGSQRCPRVACRSTRTSRSHTSRCRCLNRTS